MKLKTAPSENFRTDIDRREGFALLHENGWLHEGVAPPSR